MKRVLLWILSLCVALSLAGCGPDPAEPASVPAEPSSGASVSGGADGLSVDEMFPGRDKDDADEPSESQPPEEKDDQKEIIVYVTKTGEKYHADGCQYLRKSKIAMDLEEAIAEGYTACSKCSPPRG